MATIPSLDLRQTRLIWEISSRSTWSGGCSAANQPGAEACLQRFQELRQHLTETEELIARERRVPESLATASVPHDVLPAAIGRYRVESLLGEGGFGRVFLAYDEQLDRSVVIKVPWAKFVSTPEAAELYLNAARLVAQLDHPGIVPVYDVGHSAQFPCYIVSKYIADSTLDVWRKEQTLSYGDSARLVARLAEALHYAHVRGLFHRDVKPSNVLLDQDGQPYLVDFGLALCDASMGEVPSYVGTPAYMSPEQACREGHRVDARSDVFNLGIVLYELITGRRPFQADSENDLRDQIAKLEPRPPRQIDDRVPKELERICLKALAKRISERYATAKNLAEELLAYLEQYPALATSSAQEQAAIDTPGDNPPATPAETRAPVHFVPKGLRSFDEHDAEFFLDLLPGPRDRHGLPDSLRFWKTRIEEHEPARTFSVGLLYGPSGCGKSSLVKAGLLPRLANTVMAIYVEATSEDTEARLLAGLRRQLSDLPASFGLVETLTALRQGRFLQSGQKVLLVLDHFEQWLHVHAAGEETALVQALRQCDGGRLQCLVLVRDDFWLAVSRFLQSLEVRLVEGENSALVDFFDPRHARMVLAAFGRAYGALPDADNALRRDQNGFLDQAIADLVEAGKVVPVRLALFAEMVKGRSWTPSALREIGSAQEVGVAFLEETFAAATAPPQHRLHQRAARRVLEALLPEAGTNINGQMRSVEMLRAASGYGARRQDFDELLDILERELRLITRTDPATAERAESTTSSAAGERYYQLTHDYLVPSLRDWLTRKRRETRRGRAELRLAERSALWNAKPENCHLPSPWEWFGIRTLTHKKQWTAPQRKMIAKAGRVHGLRSAVLAAFLVALAGGGLTLNQAVKNRQVEQHRTIASDKAQDAPRRFQAACALATYGSNNSCWQDEEFVRFVASYLVSVQPSELVPWRDALRPVKKQLVESLAAIYRDQARGEQERSFATDTLADYLSHDPDRLFDLLADAEERQFQPIYDKLDAHRERAIELATAEVAKSLAADASEIDKETLAQRQANAAVLLIRLNATAEVLPLLRHSPDPRVSSYVIHWLAPRGGDPQAIIAWYEKETDVGVQRALLLCLGEFDETQLPFAERSKLVDKLQAVYRTATDAGKRAAAGWLLRTWGHGDQLVLIDKELQQNEEQLRAHGDNQRQWYVNTQGQTFVILNAGEFFVGSAESEPDRQTDANGQSVPIGRRFAISATEVTKAQCLRFAPGLSHSEFRRYPKPDCPIGGIFWYEAAAYCNWLSEREGIPEDQWCYEPNDAGEYGPGMKVKQSFLELRGYRLPTEAEWEFACRAGTTTNRYYGVSENLLARYAWYVVNAEQVTWPVANLKPNACGLFDMHGNIFEWCHDRYNAAGEKASDVANTPVVDADGRVLRGGSFHSDALFVFSAYPNISPPNVRNANLGFRVARTYP